jgi:hypothetical protein
MGPTGRRRPSMAIAGAGALSLAVGALGACGGATPQGAEAIRDYSQVGDCLRPDESTLESFLQAECDSAEATVEIIDMVRSEGAGSSPVCPPGTDLLVDVEQGPVVDGDIAAVPQTWCLRNLEAPHPGDPGEGGGELVPDDCFAIDTAGEIGEVACDGAGRTPPQHQLLAIEDTAEACPTNTTDPIELNSSPRRFLCASAAT